MRKACLSALLLLFALPLSAQTISGVAGDTLKPRGRLMPASGPGCYRDALLTSSGGFIVRDTLCWKSKDTITPPPPPPPPAPTPSGGVVWSSDWRTGQPTDGGAWTGTSGGQWARSPSWLTVIPATGLGFPAEMRNVLQVNLPASEVSQMLMVAGKWPTPPVGGTVYYRVYHRSAFPNGIDHQGYHPLQNGLSNLAWEWKTGVVANGQVTLEWWFNGSVAHYPYTHFDLSGGYLVNHSYRIEWAITRLPPGQVGQWGQVANPGRVQIRIYDEAVSTTVPVFTNDSFHQMDAAVTLTADSAKYFFSLGPSVDESFSAINLGNNGPNQGSRTGNAYEYYGGFAVCLKDWCGPYSATKG